MVDPMECASRFLRDQKGAVTVEFTVLVPFFVLLLVFFADAAVIYLSHSEMYNFARDAARRMSTGQFETREEVRQYAAQHLFLGERTYTIDPEFGAENRVTIGIFLGEAAIFGVWFEPILGDVLLATAVVRNEPQLVPTN